MFSGISRFFFSIPQKQNGLKIFFSWQDAVKAGCSKRSRGEARMNRDRVGERDREIHVHEHAHEFKRR
jgi:hypothetical protein